MAIMHTKKNETGGTVTKKEWEQVIMKMVTGIKKAVDKPEEGVTKAMYQKNIVPVINGALPNDTESAYRKLKEFLQYDMLFDFLKKSGTRRLDVEDFCDFLEYDVKYDKVDGMVDGFLCSKEVYITGAEMYKNLMKMKEKFGNQYEANKYEKEMTKLIERYNKPDPSVFTFLDAIGLSNGRIDTYLLKKYMMGQILCTDKVFENLQDQYNKWTLKYKD